MLHTRWSVLTRAGKIGWRNAPNWEICRPWRAPILIVLSPLHHPSSWLPIPPRHHQESKNIENHSHTMTTTTSAAEHMMKQVTSLLHDRQQCATLDGLAQELQISPSTASELLHEVVKNSSSEQTTSWQATLCRTRESEETHGEETIPCTGRCDGRYSS